MIPKATQDKISKYREKIKQNIIYEQNAGQNIIPLREPFTPRQPMTPREYENYQKFPSTLSRSNIRKTPLDNQTPRNYQQEERVKIVEQNISDPPKTEYQNKIQIDSTRNIDQRTVQKPPVSKSPTNRNPYFQERQGITKRKTSAIENNLQGGSRGYNQSTSNIQNISFFETFNQKPVVNSPVLPPLYPPMSPSNAASGQQVKILLQENQILSLHLNDKMERIKGLQKQLKEATKNQILHEQKYGIGISQLAAENQMIKKSTDEKVKTLVMEVKKLNEELVEKQEEWQERLNKVRKLNLDEQQEAKKNQMLMEEKYKGQLEQMRMQISMINEEFKTSKQSAHAAIENLKAQNLSLNQVIEKITHAHKIEKSQLAVQHQNQLRQTKEEYLKKNEIAKLDQLRKENELQSTIQHLHKEINKLNDQLNALKHQKQFSQVKEMQQRGKMMLELRQEKQKIQQLKHQQNSKLQKISQIQLQTAVNSYESQINEFKNTIQNLQRLLQTRGKEIQNLYKEINDMRSNYNKELTKKQAHVENFKKKMEDMSKKHIQEQECLKIKMAQLTQSNQITLRELYEKHISEVKHLSLDKDQIIKSLREKINNLYLQIEENNLLHYQEIKELEIKIEKLQQQASANVLKERNSNVHNDKESIILKENIIRQSQAYEKAANVKDENIKRLQKIIETKDKEIEGLEEKLELMKRSHKEQISLQKDQYESTIKEKDDGILRLKVELEYSRKEQSKRAEQFSHDKEYYSNQMKELKNKSEKDFNDWVENLSSEINLLKTQNQELKYHLHHLEQEYEEYKKLWNEEETLNKMVEREQQFMENLNSTFTHKYQKLIDSHEKEIQTHYKPKIKNLNELILEKQQQINDMKINYHELEVKFEKFMEQKETLNYLNDQVLSLGKSNSILASNFVTLGKGG